MARSVQYCTKHFGLIKQSHVWVAAFPYAFNSFSIFRHQSEKCVTFYDFHFARLPFLVYIILSIGTPLAFGWLYAPNIHQNITVKSGNLIWRHALNVTFGSLWQWRQFFSPLPMDFEWMKLVYLCCDPPQCWCYVSLIRSYGRWMAYRPNQRRIFFLQKIWISLSKKC